MANELGYFFSKHWPPRRLDWLRHSFRSAFGLIKSDGARGFSRWCVFADACHACRENVCSVGRKTLFDEVFSKQRKTGCWLAGLERCKSRRISLEVRIGKSGKPLESKSNENGVMKVYHIKWSKRANNSLENRGHHQPYMDRRKPWRL